jgi:hypothetical protein
MAKSAKLLLLVKDQEKALECVKKYGVKNYEIDFVPVSELKNKLSNAKFGFLLRVPDPINNVAVPTKLLTYLANGVIPIFSDSLEAVKSIMVETSHKIEYSNSMNESDICAWLKRTVDRGSLKEEYLRIYEKTYERRINVDKIKSYFETAYN